MTRQELLDQFTEYAMSHDLEEEEYDALESWVKEGNSPYTNPDHYCLYEDEISFMKWYWILVDPLHPEHKNLMDHRYRKEDDAGKIYEYPGLLKARVEEFLNIDYSASTIKEGQDWYVGNGTFLSLDETKEHLLDEMEYYKEAVREMMIMKEVIEYQLSEMNLRGNLFADVLIIKEVLGAAELSAQELRDAIKAIEKFENKFRKDYFSQQSCVPVDHSF